MPSMSLYKKILGSSTIGEAHKKESAMIMEKTWDTDIAAQTAWFYDWYHDDNKEVLNNLNPEDDENKYSMRIKYLAYSSQTLDKDMVSYHLQMKPSQTCVVPYYEDSYVKNYNAIYPIGLYCDIKDSKDNYNRWLVVAPANYNDAQFPTFELLRCDYVIHVIIDNVKYSFPAVMRSQSSYNSGLWSDMYFTSTEDQIKFIVPLNKTTEKLYYDRRIIIDANVDTEPRAWKISKVNRTFNKGVVMITCAQTEFNSAIDYKDPDTGIWWAGYLDNSVTPEEYVQTHNSVHGIISYSAKPEVKVNGGYKKFNVGFYNEDNSQHEYMSGTWDYIVDNESVKSSIVDEIDSGDGQVKIKLVNADDYLGKIMTIKFTTEDSSVIASQEVEITRL